MVGVSQGESSGPRELVVRLPPSGAGEGEDPYISHVILILLCIVLYVHEQCRASLSTMFYIHLVL